MQDGCFTLDVNGKGVIDRDDILYRDELVDNGNDQDAPSRTPSLGNGHTSTTKPHKPTSISGSTKDGGLLDPILGLLHGLGLLADLQFGVSIPHPTPTSQSDFQLTTTISSPLTLNNPQSVPTTTAAVLSIRSSDEEQVGFVGIFFR